MQGEALKKKLRSGKRVYGTLLVSSSPFWPKVVATLDLDFVFIDTEHIPLNRSELSWMCQTYRAMQLAPLVRIPSPDPYQATVALDGGAEGVIAPYVESVEEVNRLVGAVKCRPLKGEKLQKILKDRKQLEPELSGYLQQHNANNVLIVNIESVPAMEALDEILSIEELDGVLIGPHDLSCSLGIAEQYDHPRFINAVEEIIGKAQDAGKGSGIHMVYAGLEQEVAWIKKGANLVVHSADAIAFRQTIQSEIHQIKQLLGEEDASSNENINI
jgi:2-keto-3-deoxy-L-rhamnonate aldolase RhmA